MKKRWLVGLSLAMGLSVQAKKSEVAETEAHVTVDLASAYVFRGVTENDGLVIQPALEATGFGLPAAWGTFTAGMWANYNIDDYAGLASDTVSEADLYAFYALPLDAVELSVGYVRYAYPNQNDGATSNAVSRVDDGEAVVGVAYDMDELRLEGRAFYGLAGSVNKDYYYDMSVDYSMELSDSFILDFGALVGYADPETGVSGWNEAVGDVGIRFVLGRSWRLGASASYIMQLDDAVLVDSAVDAGGALGYDVDTVFKLSASCLF